MDRPDDSKIDYVGAVRACLERCELLLCNEACLKDDADAQAQAELLIRDSEALCPKNEIFSSYIAMARSRLALKRPRQALETVGRALRKLSAEAPRSA
ncbi:hypothetical protein AWB76_06279 [Caballeronia temeraria]|uniref:Uncharacterized protein n=1 Tax=Caballeronia temeraria TaxID=1777137 RepID=A0A158D0R7_9BURK|nr:hypothetical protein AWB76_06279 [Caballeronia temeraria]